MQSGHETGFGLYHELSATNVTRKEWTPTFEGGCDSIDPQLYRDWHESVFPASQFYEGHFLLDVHFHTGEIESELALSWSDLDGLDGPEIEHETRPIFGIGAVNDDGRGVILLLQRTFSGRLQDSMNGIKEQLYQNYVDASSHFLDGALATALMMPGLIHSQVLRFRAVADQSYAIITNPRVIRHFAYDVDAALTGWAQKYRLKNERLAESTWRVLTSGIEAWRKRYQSFEKNADNR